MKLRYWSYARQAYSPRWYLTTPTVALTAAGVAYLIDPPLWLAILIGVVAGGGGVQWHWWWWRRRHPLIPPEHQLDRMRQSARWN